MNLKVIKEGKNIMIINFPIDNKYMEEIVNGMLEFDKEYHKCLLIDRESNQNVPLILPEYEFIFEIEKASKKHSIRKYMRNLLIHMFKNKEWDMGLFSDEWKLTTKIMGYSTDNRNNVILVHLSVIKYEKVK